MRKWISYTLVGLSLVSVLGLSRPALADFYLYSREKKIDVNLGAGFTFNTPVHFAIEASGEYYWTNNISFGLAIDGWIRDPHAFLFRPFARYHVDLNRYPKWVPYVGAGFGFGVSSGDGFMDIVLPNVGLKYAITDNIYVGSDLSLHILTDFDATDVDVQFLIATVTFRF